MPIIADEPVAQAIKAQPVQDVSGRPLLAEGAAGNGKTGTRVTTSEEIEPVAETPNTKRQQTGGSYDPHTKPVKLIIPLICGSGGKEAQEVIQSGPNKRLAISRVGSHALNPESPPFFNFTSAEVGR